MTLGKSLCFSVPQFLHLLIGLLGSLSELTWVKHVAACLAQGEYDVGLLLCAHGTPRAMMAGVVGSSMFLMSSLRVWIGPDASFSPQHQALSMEP